MEYYSAIKKNAFESILMRWMKLEPIIQSEGHQDISDTKVNEKDQVVRVIEGYVSVISLKNKEISLLLFSTYHIISW